MSFIHRYTVWRKKTLMISLFNNSKKLMLFQPRSEQQWHLDICPRYFYHILYTNAKYGQKVQPLYWLKSQTLVDWKGLFQQNPNKLITLYLLTKFEENLYTFLGIIKERYRQSFPHSIFVSMLSCDQTILLFPLNQLYVTMLWIQ